ncbi:hypothetical protein V5735_03505 (plasmid) [Haladaptatus sp. SPP-AMP-3]|uniref:hypothetical protein n=1 Tax=Haladaptatus sp. SPP-AMP-3 TaxID=3121295 RepID=UPI003C2BE809
MAHREQTTPEDEPLLELTRNLTVTGGGSVNVNVATEACDIIGFPRAAEATGTEVVIEIYRDRYVVRPKDE